MFACTCGQCVLWEYRSHRKANAQGQENGFRSLCAIHAIFLTLIHLPRGQLEKDNLDTARMPSKCFCSRAWVLRQIWLEWGREGGDFAASWTAVRGGEHQENFKLLWVWEARAVSTPDLCVRVCQRVCEEVFCVLFLDLFYRGAASCGSYSRSLCANPRGRVLGSWRAAWPVGGWYWRVLESFASFSLPCP